MVFSEVEKIPEFTLKMSLNETIDLWRIVNTAYNNGDEKAISFVDSLYAFARNSNSYSEYLDQIDTN